MGQPITVTVRAGSSPDIRFFECDRSLTGMAIEVYPADSEVAVSGARPPDVLARRLHEAGASKVTIYSNVVTVEAPPEAWAELEPKVTHTIEHLFEFYGDEAGWSFDARGVAPEISKIQ
ncbi:MAG: hypothetical protein QOC79_2695 [Actinomycetota bacterium]|nr:hypothetical protein [Actinomycetota bacterium]